MANSLPITNAVKASEESSSQPLEGGSACSETKGEPQLGTIVANVTPDPIPDFSDVKNSHWAYNYVQYVRATEYMVGKDGNKFDPKGVLEKAEIITILYQIASPQGTPHYSQIYDDVKPSHYAFDAICWARTKNLAQILQVNATTFSPKSPVTRVKIAELLWKFAKSKGWTSFVFLTIYPSLKLPYQDIDAYEKNSDQRKAIAWCYYFGIMRGTGEGTTFSPNGTLTRAEMAVICNALDNYVTRKCAFCVGVDYATDAQGRTYDSTDQAYYARDCFQALGYTVNCITEPTASIMRDSHNMRSKILCLHGHANNYGIYFDHLSLGNKKTGVYYINDVETEDGYKLAGISGKMRLVDVAIFNGCLTAKGSDNIAYRACRYGARISIGWESEVNTLANTKWVRGFYGWLAKGYSVSAALWEMGWADINPDTGVFDWKVYTYDGDFFGTGKLKLQADAPVSTDANSIETSERPEDLLESYAGSCMLPGENVSAEVSDILSQIVEDYQSEDYKIYYHDHGLGLATIHYVRLVGGFETGSRYTACVSGNTLVRLYDQTKFISDEEERLLIAMRDQIGVFDAVEQEENSTRSGQPQQSQELAEALQLAWNETQASTKKEPFRQRYYFHYDIDQDRPYIQVYTDYYYDGTQAIGVDSYEYGLRNGGELS